MWLKTRFGAPEPKARCDYRLPTTSTVIVLLFFFAILLVSRCSFLNYMKEWSKFGWFLEEGLKNLSLNGSVNFFETHSNLFLKPFQSKLIPKQIPKPIPITITLVFFEVTASPSTWSPLYWHLCVPDTTVEAVAQHRNLLLLDILRSLRIRLLHIHHIQQEHTPEHSWFYFERKNKELPFSKV